MPSHSRSFVLKSSIDSAPTPCKWKPGTKKHGPQVCINETYVNARHVTSITLGEWLLELYQIVELTETTDLKDVFNIPLVSDILVYPVVMRVIGAQEVPSIGRVKKLLCEYLVENADNSFFPEIEEEEDDNDLPSLSDNEPMELDDDEDDNLLDEESDVAVEEDEDLIDNEEEDEDEEVDVLDDDE